MSKNLIDAMKLYKKTFNDDFPTMPLAESRTDEELIDIINACVEQKKDVYDIGYLRLEDVQY
ncbi:hypothetical protein GCM10008910_45560 [Faecalicatena orotica]|uniref:Uncharacterized protein n=1 Tax=Faecalicatena orotica TaxID=1544 RepID=A0A2Y9BHY1_9FIRM|nr:hypothetical protein A8806_106239 [Faecalicatena orotica]SSA55955.1 hypothetical protein SAMN05216536_106239 [Faecalicatena orotica]